MVVVVPITVKLPVITASPSTDRSLFRITAGVTVIAELSGLLILLVNRSGAVVNPFTTRLSSTNTLSTILMALDPSEFDIVPTAMLPVRSIRISSVQYRVPSASEINIAPSKFGVPRSGSALARSKNWYLDCSRSFPVFLRTLPLIRRVLLITGFQYAHHEVHRTVGADHGFDCCSLFDDQLARGDLSGIIGWNSKLIQHDEISVVFTQGKGYGHRNIAYVTGLRPQHDSGDSHWSGVNGLFRCGQFKSTGFKYV